MLERKWANVSVKCRAAGAASVSTLGNKSASPRTLSGSPTQNIFKIQEFYVEYTQEVLLGTILHSKVFIENQPGSSSENPFIFQEFYLESTQRVLLRTLKNPLFQKVLFRWKWFLIEPWTNPKGFSDDNGFGKKNPFGTLECIKYLLHSIIEDYRVQSLLCYPPLSSSGCFIYSLSFVTVSFPSCPTTNRHKSQLCQQSS